MTVATTTTTTTPTTDPDRDADHHADDRHDPAATGRPDPMTGASRWWRRQARQTTNSITIPAQSTLQIY